jgi:hypothetical protein
MFKRGDFNPSMRVTKVHRLALDFAIDPLLIGSEDDKTNQTETLNRLHER